MVYPLILIAILFTACDSSTTDSAFAVDIISAEGSTLESRINCPAGFERETTNAFGSFLRSFSLKEDGAPVLLYDGSKKRGSHHIAVFDIDVGNRDLQQCADAVMRLRAEYLFNTNQKEKIHFNFTNGMRVDYSKWKRGYRVKVNGNNTSWVKSAQANNSYSSFRKYMDLIFTYAGTLSLDKELNTINLNDIAPGDVFIQGGSPGHAMLVADVCENGEGKKMFLLAQSYMPAQSIHIVDNINDEGVGPWFSTNFGDELITPDWVFYEKDLKRF